MGAGSARSLRGVRCGCDGRCKDLDEDGTDDSDAPEADIMQRQATVYSAHTMKLSQFEAFLRRAGVRTELYGVSNARTLNDLWGEVMLKECTLEKRDPPLNGCTIFRLVRTVVVELRATVRQRDVYLVLEEERTGWGSARSNINTNMTRKLFTDEDTASGIIRCIVQNLEITTDECNEHIVIEPSVESVESDRDSKSYPDLKTNYTLHVARVRVRDSSHPAMSHLGLPKGTPFTTTVDGMNKRQRKCKWMTRAQFEQKVIGSKAGYRDRCDTDWADSM